MKLTQYNPLRFKKPNVDTLSLRLVPKKSKVLELGCSEGYLGNVMCRELGCVVIGVEKDKKAAELARKILHKVIVGNIENSFTLEQLEKNVPYDVIFASAILEHLVNPDVVIQRLKKLLKKNGFFIITLPNITHWTARLLLLRGKFDYQDSGIFDRTHLHFYTHNTARALLLKNDLRIVREDFEFFTPKPFSFLSRFFPNFFAYQFVFKAQPLHYET